MNSFAVFFAIIAVASANVAGRTGWDSNPPPPGPTVILAVEGAAAAVGEGQASAYQALTEGASGNADISSVNGVSAGVSQHLTDPETYTYNEVAASNTAIATDSLVASITGDDLAYVTNAAGTDASGAGAVAIEGSSLNYQVNPNPAPGWAPAPAPGWAPAPAPGWSP